MVIFNIKEKEQTYNRQTDRSFFKKRKLPKLNEFWDIYDVDEDVCIG